MQQASGEIVIEQSRLRESISDNLELYLAQVCIWHCPSCDVIGWVCVGGTDAGAALSQHRHYNSQCSADLYWYGLFEGLLP